MHLMGRRRDGPGPSLASQRFEALARMADDLDGCVDLVSLLETAAEHACGLLGADHAWLQLGPDGGPTNASSADVIVGSGRLDDGEPWFEPCSCPSPLDRAVGEVTVARCGSATGADTGRSQLHAAVALGGARGVLAVLHVAYAGRPDLEDVDDIDDLDDDARRLLGIVAPMLTAALERLLLPEGDHRETAERRLTEDALAASERRFRSLVQNASELIVVFGGTGEPSYASPASQRVLGLAPEELLGAWPGMVHSDDRFVVSRELRTVAAGAETARVELRARHRDGSWRTLEGTLTNLLDDPDVGGIVANLRDVTERSRVVQELTRRTFFDPLTQLPNRTQILDRLDVALGSLRSGSRAVALLVVDLDQFSVVNDSLGHATGDALLLGLARRLEGVVPREMLLARIGGDELAILDERCESRRAAVAIGERVVEALRVPFHVAGREVFVTASIGIAVTDSVSVDAEELMRDADAALNRAKRSGRNRVQLFDEEMRAWSLARLESEHELRRALERGELRVLFQPEIWVRSGGIAGLEALVAWQHPERGLLNAGRFIDLAEESGLVVPISEWVLVEACREAKRWNDRSGPDQPVPVSVNVSARQLDRPDLPDVVARALALTDLDPGLLWLEITESALIEDPAHGIEILQALRDLGVTIVVDDFGTGYSSLVYLRRLPIDVLKIDRCFVDGLGRDAQDTAIVSSVIELGHAFGLLVVAEGVERFEQLEAVADLGCEIAQGYHWSRPMAPEALEQWWSTYTPTPPDPAPTRVAVACSAPSGADRRVPGSGEMHRFVLEATRAVLRAECPEEVVGIATALVRGLGGSTVPARCADARALAIDLSFGEGEPLFPAAEPASVARVRIERVLPQFVEDARHLVERLQVLGPMRSNGTDHLTGLQGREAFERLLPRLRPGDSVALIQVGEPGSGEADEADLVRRSFSRLLREHARISDRCARLDAHLFGVTMTATDPRGAAMLVERLRDEWRRVRPRPVPVAAGVALVGAEGVADAMRRAQEAMRAARQGGGDRIEVAEPLGA